jgi:hypothetical protein
MHWLCGRAFAANDETTNKVRSHLDTGHIALAKIERNVPSRHALGAALHLLEAQHVQCCLQLGIASCGLILRRGCHHDIRSNADAV